MHMHTHIKKKKCTGKHGVFSITYNKAVYVCVFTHGPAYWRWWSSSKETARQMGDMVTTDPPPEAPSPSPRPPLVGDNAFERWKWKA
jgi:hypothetical protein